MPGSSTSRLQAVLEKMCVLLVLDVCKQAPPPAPPPGTREAKEAGRLAPPEKPHREPPTAVLHLSSESERGSE